MSCESFQRKRKGERANEPQPGAAEGSPPPGAGVFGSRFPCRDGAGGPGPARGAQPSSWGCSSPGPSPRSGRSSRRRAAALSPQSRLGGSRLGFLINQVRAKELFTLKKSFEEGRKGQAEQAAFPQPAPPAPLQAAGSRAQRGAAGAGRAAPRAGTPTPKESFPHFLGAVFLLKHSVANRV